MDEDVLFKNHQDAGARTRRKRGAIFDYIDTEPEITILVPKNESEMKESRRTTRDIGNSYHIEYQPRHSNHEYFIEVMVVADKRMADYHKEKLHFYIMTLMSHVRIILYRVSVFRLII